MPKEKAIVQCAECGAEKQIWMCIYNKSKTKRFFCNTKCKAKWQSTNTSGKNSPLYDPVTVHCANCNKVKQINKSRFNTTKRFYCGLKCKGEWQRKNNMGKNNARYKGGKVEVSCEVCGAIKKVYPSYKAEHPISVCSNKCMGIYTSQQFKGRARKQHIEFSCSYCGKVVDRYPSKANKTNLKFCNKTCHNKWKEKNDCGENNPNWKGGLSFEPYPVIFDKELKETIRERDNRTCQYCGMDEVENGENLAVHHIDYNKENCLPENLISLCHDCHVKTNFYREEWAAFFNEQITKYNEQGAL